MIEVAIERTPRSRAAFWPRHYRRVYTSASYTEVEASAFGLTLYLSVRHRGNQDEEHDQSAGGAA